MTREARRKASRLLRDAQELAMARIHEDVLAAPAIAARTVVLIEEAARITPRVYTRVEAAVVEATVEQRMTQGWPS